MKTLTYFSHNSINLVRHGSSTTFETDLFNQGFISLLFRCFVYTLIDYD